MIRHNIFKNVLFFVVVLIPVVVFIIPEKVYHGDSMRGNDLIRTISNIAPFVWVIMVFLFNAFVLQQKQNAPNTPLMITIGLLALLIFWLPYRFDFTTAIDHRIREWAVSIWLIFFFICKKEGLTTRQFNIFTYVFLMPIALWQLLTSVIF